MFKSPAKNVLITGLAFFISISVAYILVDERTFITNTIDSQVRDIADRIGNENHFRMNNVELFSQFINSIITARIDNNIKHDLSGVFVDLVYNSMASMPDTTGVILRYENDKDDLFIFRDNEKEKQIRHYRFPDLQEDTHTYIGENFVINRKSVQFGSLKYIDIINSLGIDNLHFNERYDFSFFIVSRDLKCPRIHCTIPEGYQDANLKDFGKPLIKDSEGNLFITYFFFDKSINNSPYFYIVLDHDTVYYQYIKSAAYKITIIFFFAIVIFAATSMFLYRRDANRERYFNATNLLKEKEAYLDKQRRLLELFDKLPFGVMIVRDDFSVMHISGNFFSIMEENGYVIARNTNLPSTLINKFFFSYKPSETFDVTLYNNGVERIFQFVVNQVGFDMFVNTPSNDLEPTAKYVLSCTDVTHERELERGLKTENEDKTKEISKLLEKEKENSEAKSVFLSTVSHEMRTPLNGILGALGLVSQHGMSNTDKKYLNIIRQSSSNLLRLVNDVLDFTKIQSNKLEMIEKRFDIVESLDKLVQAASINKKPNVEVLIDDLGVFNSTVIGDPLRFDQVITNLLSNAFKFTDAGYVTIYISMTSESHGFTEFSVLVKDTGVGIPLDKQEIIFNRFSQANSEVQHTHGGTGLGLAISKRLCEMMGGDLTCQSEPRLGSIFTARFKFKSAPYTAISTYRSKRIYIPFYKGCDFEHAYRNKLLHYGFDVVHEPEDADATFIFSPVAGSKYDLTGLPKPVILFGNTNIEVSGGEALNISLPGLSLRTLYNVIEFNVDVNIDTNGKEEIESDKRDYNKRKVLIVDDNETNRVVIDGFLTALNFTVYAAVDGEDAIEKNNKFKPELILMDLQMPRMNGLDATKHIRTNAENDKVPIVALTAAAMAGDRERCKKAGMNGFLSKPIILQELIEVLDSLFEIKAHKQQNNQVDGNIKSLSTSTGTQSQHDIVWDEDGFIARLQNMESLIAKVKASFIKRWPDKLTALEMSYDDDIEITRKTAHAFKGMAKEISAINLANVLYTIEKNAAEGKRSIKDLHIVNEAIDILIRRLA